MKRKRIGWNRQYSSSIEFVFFFFFLFKNSDKTRFHDEDPMKLDERGEEQSRQVTHFVLTDSASHSISFASSRSEKSGEIWRLNKWIHDRFCWFALSTQIYHSTIRGKTFAESVSGFKAMDRRWLNPKNEIDEPFWKIG